jgi:hypothetical protein
MSVYTFVDEITFEDSFSCVYSFSDDFSAFISDEFSYCYIVIDVTDWGCVKYSYDQLLTLFEDITKPADRFVPDYFTLRYLEKEAMLDRASVAMLAVALSNLLRLATENDVDDIHFVSLRIRKIYSEVLQKFFFVITDY